MPLLRKRTQADQLARRLQQTRAGGALDRSLLALLRDLELPAEPLQDGWVVELGAVEVVLVGVQHEGVVAGMLPLPPVTEAEGLLEFLHFNLDRHLAYSAAAQHPPALDARIRIPAEPFEREAMLQGLQALAEVAEALLEKDQRAVLRRIRAARRPLEPGAVHERVNRDLASALADLDLQGIPRAEDQWNIVTERGPIGALLDPRGETWMFLHPVEYTDGVQNAEILRWLLDVSAARAARLGMQRDTEQLFSAFVLPSRAVNAWSVGYVVEDILRLSDEYDAENRRHERKVRR